MPSVCFYFQVHQPFRLSRYRIFDIGKNHNYFSDTSQTSSDNQYILERVSRKCYLPMNALLLETLRKYPETCFSFSFSGVLLEQLERWQPHVLNSFRELVKTGRVEVLAETSHHSFSFLSSLQEFREQVALHQEMISRIFGVIPRVFRGTELMYSNSLAQEVSQLGYHGMLTEGADRVLGWQSPNYLYSSTASIPLLLKNYRLSDDIAFRFSEQSWSSWPLQASTFANWISQTPQEEHVVNLFMDYETFGEHQWKETGIFSFMKQLPQELLLRKVNFLTPSEAFRRFSPVAPLNIPDVLSWADTERDLSAWLDNEMQKDAFSRLYKMEDSVRKTNNPALLEDWRRLQTSDHFYYMCTKWFADGDVHKYFNAHESPYEAYIAFMNVTRDMEWRLQEASERSKTCVPKSVIPS
ncbi:MAG: glycoside hydrolase family 57 protein [bacterium]|nr:glycoside hydrolase family 57 protein [bacterium]